MWIFFADLASFRVENSPNLRTCLKIIKNNDFVPLLVVENVVHGIESGAKSLCRCISSYESLGGYFCVIPNFLAISLGSASLWSMMSMVFMATKALVKYHVPW